MKKIELRKVKQGEFSNSQRMEKFMFVDITSAAAKDTKRICLMM